MIWNCQNISTTRLCEWSERRNEWLMSVTVNVPSIWWTLIKMQKVSLKTPNESLRKFEEPREAISLLQHILSPFENFNELANFFCGIFDGLVSPERWFIEQHSHAADCRRAQPKLATFRLNGKVFLPKLKSPSAHPKIRDFSLYEFDKNLIELIKVGNLWRLWSKLKFIQLSRAQL